MGQLALSCLESSVACRIFNPLLRTLRGYLSRTRALISHGARQSPASHAIASHHADLPNPPQCRPEARIHRAWPLHCVQGKWLSLPLHKTTALCHEPMDDCDGVLCGAECVWTVDIWPDAVLWRKISGKSMGQPRICQIPADSWRGAECVDSTSVL